MKYRTEHSEHANARYDVSVKRNPTHVVYASAPYCARRLLILLMIRQLLIHRDRPSPVVELALPGEQTEISTVSRCAPFAMPRRDFLCPNRVSELTAPGTRMKLVRYTERGVNSLRRDDRYSTPSNSLVEELIARDVQYQP